MLCFRKFLLAKMFMDKREGEVSRFSFETSLSRSAEKLRRATLQRVTIFGYRKNLCFRGLCYDSPSKVFCPTVPKLFERNPSVLCFKKFLLTKKFMDERVWGVSRVSVENFLSQSAEKLHRATL